jgi:acyl dehydratase
VRSDPEFAEAAGFDVPIRPGLCTYGMVAATVTDMVLDGDARRVLTARS